MNGSRHSARSATDTSSSPWPRARSSNHRPIGRPTRPGRVLAMMISRCGMIDSHYPAGAGLYHEPGELLAQAARIETEIRVDLLRRAVAADHRARHSDRMQG